jgi:CO/xanthine dehydrogenase Mo-binding subunit
VASANPSLESLRAPATPSRLALTWTAPPTRATRPSTRTWPIRVDPETGELRVLNYVAAQETGVMLNPIGFLGQIYGGFSQGPGHSLTEELPLDAGRVTVASLLDYKIPSIGDMPPMQAVVIESSEGEGPYHTRGIGNKPISLPAPAIANAIADACGARITQTPFTAERIYRALRAAKPDSR